MQEQTRQAFRNIETILEAAASSLDRIVNVTVLLARPDLQRDERGISGVLPWGKTCANDG
jgi:enamine deaminase RidA (YjgF/YER057c/UK114 family)